MSMELDHSFTVPVPPDRAWDVLLDVEAIAPCMPGATVEDFDGEVVTGRIKVKVGPVSLTYRGTAKFTERDPATRVMVVDASGKETRGAGTASAAVRATLEPAGDGTQVLIHTTMNVTGRPAQFGRGVIVEVGGKLVEKFAENLAQMISAGSQAAPDSVTDGAGAAGIAGTAEVAEMAGIAETAGIVGAAASDEDEDTIVVSALDSAALSSPVQGDGASKVNAGSVATATAPTGPGSTQPAAVVRPAAPAPAAAPNEDSINLIRLVGPAILKRVLPAAAAAVLVALLGRRFLHGRRHG
ncbi:MAG: SRPBCC family protein [Actinomycetota bacterium]|nr:SRPBCC family protein [Actinomycetota bacterium]